MNHETFFENFELLVDASNRVQKLREQILLLAFQGKLVPQDPEDEPAALLLEKIKSINERLAKKSKANTSINEDSVPFILPKDWEWTRLGEIAEITMGNSPPGNTYNENGEGVPLINGPVEFSEGPFGLTIKSKFTTKPTKFCEKADLLICVRGSTTGKTNVAGFKACIGRGVAAIRSKVHQSYINYFILSMRQQIYDLGTGSTFPSISQNHLLSFFVPIPPLEEQKRIVTKVDQLMALCDELEARQEKKHEQRILLNNAALDKLLTAPTPEEFTQHWQRICDNFDLLYDAPETVRQLRQAILQLAVQGKLVAQDPGDEPATVLLEEIKSEKKQLVKDKKIRKVKPLPPIKENEISYKLPDKWEWARLGDALLKITDGTHHSPPNGPKGEFKYITAKNIKSGGINLSNITYVSKAVHEEIYNRCDPESGDILYIKDGATTGIVTINELNEQFSMLSSVALLKNPSKIYNRYLLYVLRSPYFYSLMRDDMSGVAITRVTLTKLNRALIPLAPFEEQKRIVAKVDQLMALCDELEAGLAQAQTEGGRLMEAVVHHVLAG